MFRGTPWWKLRKHMSEEHRRKISETRKRLFATGQAEETRLKLRLKATGRIVSAKTRERISQAQRKRKGETRSLRARQNISASLIGRLSHEDNPNWRGGKYQQCCYCGREFWVIPSRQYRTRYCSKKCQYLDPEYRRRAIMGCNRRPNEQERQLEEILNKYFPNDWKFVGDGSIIILGLNPDFINCNGQKKIIEMFGDYWHSKEDIAWHQTELGRIMAYNSVGYQTLIIWEHELEDKRALITKIRIFARDNGANPKRVRQTQDPR